MPSQASGDWLDLGERLLVCGRLLRAELAGSLTRRGLVGPELWVLWACRRAPAQGLAQHELAATLALSPAQISGLVEKLHGKGFLKGHRPVSDRRCQLWWLTPQGHHTLRAVLEDLSASGLARAARGHAVPIGKLGRLLDRLLKVLGRKSLAAEIARPTAAHAARKAHDGEAA